MPELYVDAQKNYRPQPTPKTDFSGEIANSLDALRAGLEEYDKKTADAEIQAAQLEVSRIHSQLLQVQARLNEAQAKGNSFERLKHAVFQAENKHIALTRNYVSEKLEAIMLKRYGKLVSRSKLSHETQLEMLHEAQVSDIEQYKYEPVVRVHEMQRPQDVLAAADQAGDELEKLGDYFDSKKNT